MIVESQGTLKPAKLLQRLGGLTLIGSTSACAGQKPYCSATALHGRSSVSSIKRELDSMNLSVGLKYEAARHVENALGKFEALNLGAFRAGGYAGKTL